MTVQPRQNSIHMESWANDHIEFSPFRAISRISEQAVTTRGKSSQTVEFIEVISIQRVSSGRLVSEAFASTSPRPFTSDTAITAATTISGKDTTTAAV